MNLVGLPLLCVEAHAQTQGIDREREHNCRALLSRDRIERLKQASSETQENQVERVMFFLFFFVLQKIKLQTNRNGIEIVLWLVMLLVCFSCKTPFLNTNNYDLWYCLFVEEKETATEATPCLSWVAESQHQALVSNPELWLGLHAWIQTGWTLQRRFQPDGAIGPHLWKILGQEPLITKL